MKMDLDICEFIFHYSEQNLNDNCFPFRRGRMTGGGDINSLGLLPDKLKTEIALHVNLETLKKVRSEPRTLINFPEKNISNYYSR